MIKVERISRKMQGLSLAGWVGDSKDRMAMGHVLNYFALDMLCELHCPRSSA